MDPVRQHDLPKTYLRRFVIDPNNRRLRSFIWCFWKDQYGSQIRSLSIDSKHFKTDHFYSINLKDDPFLVENTFTQIVEPIYNKILDEIEKEQNLSLDCRLNLITWLFYNNNRSKYYRDNIERLANFMIEIPYSMKYGKAKYESLRKEAERVAKLKAKEIQIKSFIDEELVNEFQKGLGTKHWILLKSRKDNLFLTNDNPGFSVDVEMGRANMKSLVPLFSTNYKSSNYFVLTPKYCLLISPFYQGTDLNTSIHNQEIEFKITNNKHIDFINTCTRLTRNKYVISNNKEALINSVKQEINNPTQ